MNRIFQAQTNLTINSEQDDSKLQSYIATIKKYLQEQYEENKESISEQKLEEVTKIEISKMERLKENLKNMKNISIKNNKYIFVPDNLIETGNDLMNILREKKFMTKSELDGNLKEVSNSLKELIQDGIIGEFPSSHKDKVYFYFDDIYKEKKVSLKLIEEWKKTEIEIDDDSLNKKLKEYQYPQESILKLVNIYPKDNDEIEKKRKKREKSNKIDINDHMSK